MKRKEFLKTTAFAAGGSVFLPSFSSLTSNPSKFMGANDRLRVGAIGINGMGWSDTKSLLKIPGVELGPQALLLRSRVCTPVGRAGHVSRELKSYQTM